MPRPRFSPERGHTFCASLCSQNAFQHFTRATLYGNLQENARAQSEDPDQAPAFTTTVRTPQCGHSMDIYIYINIYIYIYISIPDAPCMEYLPWLIFGVNVGIHIPAPWRIWE